MLTGPHVILTLKIAVATVTVIFACSLIALVRGRYRLHGRINLVFMVLTLVAVLGLEVVIRLVDPRMFEYFDDKSRWWLRTHLMFSIPSAILLPIMYFTGRTGRVTIHYGLAIVFSVCWIGTFVTGIFFLPH